MSGRPRPGMSHASVRSTIQRLGSTTNPLVWGFETDIQASGQKGGSTFGALTATPAALTTLTTDHKLSWFGTSRSSVDPRLNQFAEQGLAAIEVGNRDGLEDCACECFW